jgi:GNAT superfamily N-acetyltransferase
MSLVNSFIVRDVRLTDAAELARLSSELGYPVSTEVLSSRIRRILESRGDHLLLAESASGGVVGWIHGFLNQLVESDYRVEIGGLIVDAAWRRRGVGRALVLELRGWAAGHGARELGVRCRIERGEAHRFYESLGFRRTKTQHVFRWAIGEPPHEIRS